ncbi:hypothetical protein SAMN04515666_11948 [Bosea lupini]|uniref:Uncharacterized protein n=1 Tax=Bosea lupini TaxID=1036779 RepID=A0A1H8AG29_9HYPH|nr:hypothetical protein [Bosea lupini]SEM69715.1 hypothetical protein SAMN04515666_11948 [Bosea lupini]
MSAAVPTFDEFCRVWPMRDEAERAEARIAFGELPEDQRARAVAGAEVLAAMHQELGGDRKRAARAIRSGGLGGWAELGRMVPEYRELNRRARPA